jgi:hypothetical protein
LLGSGHEFSICLAQQSDLHIPDQSFYPRHHRATLAEKSAQRFLAARVLGGLRVPSVAAWSVASVVAHPMCGLNGGITAFVAAFPEEAAGPGHQPGPAALFYPVPI